MPSRVPAGGFGGEGFGIVYLEADAHGCPSVAGNVGGAVDAVVDGETGLLVDPEDHVMSADALDRLLRDEPRRRAMGAAGAERAAEFAWPLIAARVGRAWSRRPPAEGRPRAGPLRQPHRRGSAAASIRC